MHSDDAIVGSMPPLLLTAIWSYLPTSTHHAYVCSAGSLGYHALKEMLQNGMPDNTLLLESGDLREVGVSTPVSTPTRGYDVCCTVYTYQPGYHPDIPPYHITPNVPHITMYTNHVVLPDMGVLVGSDQLSSIDMSPMCGGGNMRGIGRSFLVGCVLLKTINLTPLSNITVIQDAFMKGCSSLATLDLTPLTHIIEIKGSFLESCCGLKSLDLNPMVTVRRIGASFLRYCIGIQTPLDLTAPLFSNMGEIRGSFLAFCTKLTSLNLTPLSNVTVVHNSFLLGCTGLTSLDLSPLSQLTVIEGMFLAGCSGLISLDLSPLSNVTEVKWFFLDTCMGLTALDLAPLAHVTKLGSHFLNGCSGITTLNLSPLSNVITHEFKSPFLDGCTRLSEIVSPPPLLCTSLFDGWRMVPDIVPGSSSDHRWERVVNNVDSSGGPMDEKQQQQKQLQRHHARTPVQQRENTKSGCVSM